MKKAESQRRHALKRAGERYGVAVGDDTLRRIVQQIQSGEATFIRRQSQRISIFEIEFVGQPCRVVYDSQRKTIVTFLPGNGEAPAGGVA